jgi:pimeloyl-ACP methyl ester carboxylesterase
VKRRWKILLGLLAVLAVLLAVNTVTTGSQTKPAELTADDGQILELSRGAVQVTDSTAGLDAEAAKAFALSQPIVLLHCYTCSLHWFDKIEPLLAANHRVIRIDLLGFGGSEKPEAGYEIPTQAAMVAEAMNELDVQGALVAGNSMGAMVTASLAEQASQLVDRAVVIDMAPNTDEYGDGLPLLARLGYVPVLGEALWRVTPDFVVRDAYEESFAPGFDVESGFDDPDQVLADFDGMTYTSFDTAPAKADDYVEELPLDERFKQVPVPLLVIFGAEDQIFDAEDAVEGYADVPGVQTEIVEDAGHAPQVEQPEAVAELLEAFAVELEPAEARRAVGARRTRGDQPDRPKKQDNRGKRNKKERQQ